jgi:hypothetical protein
VVTVKQFDPTGKCSLCQEEEAVQVAFADGSLNGSLCKKHLWEAMRARSGKEVNRVAPSERRSSPAGA